jgi:hypothetical protein
MWIAIAGLAAAGVAAVWLWPQTTDDDARPKESEVARREPAAADGSRRTEAPVVAERSEPAPPNPSEAPGPRVIVVRSGTFVDGDGHIVPFAAALDVGTATAQGDACVRAGDSEACFLGGSELAVARDEDETVLTLASGRVDVDAPVASTFIVQVAGDRVVHADAAVFVVEVRSDERWSLEVEQGEVRVTARAGTTTLVRAGESRTFAAKSSAPMSAAQWLTRARTRRGAGDPKGAIAAYEGLVEHYPTAAAARTAMVTLGQLHLDVGQPAAALKWFDRYLAKKGGPLAEDAAYGRIRALRALGRGAEEEKAIAAFLAAYPASSYAAKLRTR